MSLSTSASSRRRNLSCKAWIRKRLVSTPMSAVISNSSSSSRSSASTTLRPAKSRSSPPLRASRVRPNRSRRRRNIPRRSASSGTSPISSRSSASQGWPGVVSSHPKASRWRWSPPGSGAVGMAGAGDGSPPTASDSAANSSATAGAASSPATSELGSVSSTRGAAPFSPYFSFSLPLRRNQRRISKTW